MDNSPKRKKKNKEVNASKERQSIDKNKSNFHAFFKSSGSALALGLTLAFAVPRKLDANHKISSCKGRLTRNYF